MGLFRRREDDPTTGTIHRHRNGLRNAFDFTWNRETKEVHMGVINANRLQQIVCGRAETFEQAKQAADAWLEKHPDAEALID
jgi:hypothetical protein